MRRTLLSLTLLLPACGVEELEAIIAMYDTFGSTGSSGSTGSTGSTSSTSPASDTGFEPDTTSEPGTTDTSGAAGTGSGSTGPDTTAASATATDPGATDSTGAPAPVCGDGLTEGDEECDDANAVEADGCRNDCTREWFVFMTSEPFTTQGNLGGILGADYECRHRATKMFLRNGERYMAWISSSDVQPIDRLHHARGPYKLVNGVQIAKDWDALVSGQLEHPIDISELGEPAEGPVFTGTQPSGERATNSTFCDDWTDGYENTWYGTTQVADENWTFAYQSDCGAFAGVYCFEQP